MTEDEKWMRKALDQAQRALDKDEVPIGCVIVKDGQIISRGYNQRETRQQAEAHAEMIAIRKACKKLGTWRLEGCALYVTLEPCVMCAGAISQARLERVVYGAKEKRWLALSRLMKEEGAFNHYPKIQGGVLEETCSKLISSYFRKKRNQ